MWAICAIWCAAPGSIPTNSSARPAGSEAMGGPDIPLDQVQVDGIFDPAFNGAYLHASAVLDQLNGLYGEVSHIPLVAPVNGANFDRTSGFGARIDPFTGRYAFHPGIDFAGPWGAAVMATAAEPWFSPASRAAMATWSNWITAMASIHATVICPR